MAKRTVSILAFGDLAIEHCLGQNPLFELSKESDLTFANLESPLTDRGVPSDKPITLRASPELVSQLNLINLSVVSLANNHALDYGVEGLRQTQDILQKIPIKHVGSGENLREAMRPVFIERRNVRIGFLAFSSTLPTGSAATDERSGIAPIRVQSAFFLDGPVIEEQPGTAPYVTTQTIQQDLDNAISAVQTARNDCDLLVVSLHWGVPPLWTTPSQGALAEYQRPLGHALVDAGANVVFGHHPHVVHGIEMYRNCPIFYSLGNFIFHPLAKGKKIKLQRPLPPYQFGEDSDFKRAFAVRFYLNPKASTKPILAIEIIPFHLDDKGEPMGITKNGANALVAEIQKHSLVLNTTVNLGQGLWKDQILSFRVKNL